MATQTQTLTLTRREKLGTTGSKAARREGMVPGVLYGHGQDPVAIAINAKAFTESLHAGHGKEVFAIELDGAHDTAMVRDLQRDPVSRRIISADLQRVGRDESIHANVSVTTVGIAIGVKDSGGVLDVVAHSLEISGPADRVPETLRIDITNLALHQHVLAKDVELPEGFKMLTSADTMVISIESSRTEKQAEADLTQATPAPVAPEAAPSGAASA